METYYELLAEMEAAQQLLEEAKKGERAIVLRDLNHSCNEFGFTGGMLKGVLVEGRKKP